MTIDRELCSCFNNKPGLKTFHSAWGGREYTLDTMTVSNTDISETGQTRVHTLNLKLIYSFSLNQQVCYYPVPKGNQLKHRDGISRL